MKAMALTAPAAGRLDPVDLPRPEPGADEVVVRVTACGVCRTDLHVVDGDLPDAGTPRVPGHEVVGVVEAAGPMAAGVSIGDRVGIPWLASTCGACAACLAGRENLCAAARFTGYHRDGGFAEYAAARAAYVLPLPGGYGDVEAAPLLCAGLIGYRAYRMAGEGRRLGLYGFGAAAHVLAQVARADGREVYAFTKPGDDRAQAFARRLGAAWAGDSTMAPPERLDAAILFAPVGSLVPEALGHVVPGGTVVCAGIHMSDIPSFSYRRLWEERVVRSVANLTREDGRAFLARASRSPIATHTRRYRLADANEALDDLRAGRFDGAAVLVP
ncbi:MAG: zinc-dependent alcohol dehydrogenase family protein [Vicinamibacterales bacterium]